jgi:hypothetical protein
MAKHWVPKLLQSKTLRRAPLWEQRAGFEPTSVSDQNDHVDASGVGHGDHAVVAEIGRG